MGEKDSDPPHPKTHQRFNSDLPDILQEQRMEQLAFHPQQCCVDQIKDTQLGSLKLKENMQENRNFWIKKEF